jgi:14-3-3 protein
MASSEVDQKFLGQFAKNIANDNALLSAMLFKILGLSVILSKQLVRARKLRKLDPTRATKSLDLYFHILWLSREGLVIVEEYVLPMVESFGDLKVLAYKLRASFYHIFVLFHNQPSVNHVASQKIITTPPGLASPRAEKVDKGKGPDRGSPPPEDGRSSVQPPHPMEGGPVGGTRPPGFEVTPAASFLLPARDYIPTALASFQEASDLAERFLSGSHPLRLSVKLEFSAFLYDCMHDGEASRRLAKTTIAEVYNAQEGMDDEMFEDAAELVSVLGRMMKRGLGSGTPGSTPGMASSGSKSTPRISAGSTSRPAVPSPGMDNPI